jgi:hypothetical protein
MKLKSSATKSMNNAGTEALSFSLRKDVETAHKKLCFIVLLHVDFMEIAGIKKGPAGNHQFLYGVYSELK